MSKMPEGSHVVLRSIHESRVLPCAMRSLRNQLTAMKSIRIILTALFACYGLATAFSAEQHGSHHAQSGDLTKEQKKFLANYEGVRAALAADNLETAKRSAANLTESKAGAELAKASSIAAARATFKKLSAEAVQLAKGRAGYYIANCPMAGANWVQTNKTINNPYYGKAMLASGSVEE